MLCLLGRAPSSIRLSDGQSGSESFAFVLSIAVASILLVTAGGPELPVRSAPTLRDEDMEHFHAWIGMAAHFIEALAVVIMVGFIMVGTVTWIFNTQKLGEKTYEHYRKTLGKALLVGLELLVAADIIRTVVLEPTLMSLAVLGLLVLVRTALGWTLTIEVEGHWPWQAGNKAGKKTGEV